MKVCFETFGCRLNKAEALQMEAEYLAKGWVLTEKHSDADLFIVRGCSVTARAQYDSEKLIEHLRKHYPRTPLRVYGCIEKKSKATGKEFEFGNIRFRGHNQADGKTPVPTRTARAYLKVQDGCNGKCAFCIVPKFRGNSKSVDFTETMDAAKRFIDAGYHEIVVTGCNLTLYASQGKRLPDLLTALSQLDDGCRIRLGSVEPGDCAIETIHAMSERQNICRFLHLPIQSGSSRILVAMRRPYTSRKADETVNVAKRLMPNLGLGCDMMTGFPDENDTDFRSTNAFLVRHAFNNIHVFPYSERPGTPAVVLPNRVPSHIRSTRAHELSNTVASQRKGFAKSFIGKTVEIVVEDAEKGRGWTSEYLPCEVMGTFERKSLVKVFVNKVKDDLLIGKQVVSLTNN